MKNRLKTDSRGFTLAEILAVLVIIGILTATGVPLFLSYWQSATVTAGARELATVLGRARQLAIAQNTTVCVSRSSNRVQFLTGGCAGTVWTGPGTDGSGWFTLQNGVNVSAATANAVFNYLGAAPTTGTYTVQDPVSSRTMSVTVASSGRITIGP